MVPEGQGTYEHIKSDLQSSQLAGLHLTSSLLGMTTLRLTFLI